MAKSRSQPVNLSGAQPLMNPLSLGQQFAGDVYPGTKHNRASVSSLYSLVKKESKTNCFNIIILGLKRPNLVSE